jgi:hypothetical protein
MPKGKGTYGKKRGRPPKQSRKTEKQLRKDKKWAVRNRKRNRKNMLGWASRGEVEGSILSPFNIADIRLRARDYRKRGGK